VAIQFFDVPGSAFGSPEAPVVETDGLDVVLGQLMSDMCAVSDVGVEPVEHDDQRFGFLFGRVLIGSQLDELLVLVEHFELDEVDEGEHMLALRVGRGVAVLLCVLDPQLSLGVGELEVFPVLVQFVLHSRQKSNFIIIGIQNME
jgi:hypothetical protein